MSVCGNDHVGHSALDRLDLDDAIEPFFASLPRALSLIEQHGLENRQCWKSLTGGPGVYFVCRTAQCERAGGSERSVRISQVLYVGETRKIRERIRLMQASLDPDARSRRHPVGFNNHGFLLATQRIPTSEMMILLFCIGHDGMKRQLKAVEEAVLRQHVLQFGTLPLFNSFDRRRRSERSWGWR